MCNWIKCSDKLPPIGDDVLVYAPDGSYDGGRYMTVAKRYGLEGNWSWLGEGDYEDWAPSKIEFWMLLPEPPRD